MHTCLHTCINTYIHASYMHAYNVTYMHTCIQSTHTQFHHNGPRVAHIQILNSSSHQPFLTDFSILIDILGQNPSD